MTSGIISRESERETLYAMRTCGGYFVAQLGKTALNADSNQFFEELVHAHRTADASNQAKIAAAFPALSELLVLTAAERYTMLRDAFQDVWEEYAPCSECDGRKVVPAGPMLLKANGEPDGQATEKPCPKCQGA